jgi:membrane protein DedA with SNARE-associated domain
VHIEQTVLALVAAYGLPIVALMVFIAELGLPTGMSPKVALMIAGSVSLHSNPELAGGLVAVAAANVLGTVALHAASRTGGTRLVARLSRRNDGPEGMALDRWRARLRGHDSAAIFLGRIVPMVRIYVTVAAGLTRMPWRNFLLGAAPAALVWSGTPLALGYYFRQDVQQFAGSGSSLSQAFFLVVPLFGVVGALAWVVWRRLARRWSPALVIPK